MVYRSVGSDAGECGEDVFGVMWRDSTEVGEIEFAVGGIDVTRSIIGV